MIRTWQLQTAKNHFSEVVAEASQGNPQLVTKNGHPAVYVVDCDTYEKAMRKQGPSRKELLRSRPHKDVALVIERSREPGREVEL